MIAVFISISNKFGNLLSNIFNSNANNRFRNDNNFIVAVVVVELSPKKQSALPSESKVVVNVNHSIELSAKILRAASLEQRAVAAGALYNQSVLDTIERFRARKERFLSQLLALKLLHVTMSCSTNWSDSLEFKVTQQ